MSVAEVVEQIPLMSDPEVRQLEAALRNRRVEAARKTAVNGGIGPGFEAVVQKVFSTHEELLRKLAQ